MEITILLWFKELKRILFVQRKMAFMCKDPSIAVISLPNMHFSLAFIIITS